MEQPQRAAPQVRRDDSNRAADDNSPRIAHTLTACCRCRTRKTRCDPGLPRCGPCERANSHCEYYDPTKSTKIPRNYVVHLQHKVRELEKQLGDLDKDEVEPDPEDVIRRAASVRIQESDETRFLGPSSGIAITRLVMQLAKRFTDSKNISDIVSDASQAQIKARFAQEDLKPTSKIYPLISDVAAESLPNHDLTDRLIQLFFLKVHAMYPIFHEPTFLQDADAVYKGSTDPYQNFALRMVIAVSLQRMDTTYAGLADSYYLAALQYLEPVVQPMNLKTLQGFAIIACYSLLTPTRTAVYYIIGLATRLVQALGLNEEKTIIRGKDGQRADPLEIDMRRRMFWIILVMECGLSHSLGRPCILATRQEHFQDDVKFPEMVEDEYVTRNGILPAPQPSLKKWIAIHFYRMRMLQLEIRRKLYQRKRPEPQDDHDPWFQQMEAKLNNWRDASPNDDGCTGLDKVWFIGRYNTMIVFLFRPSPQVPRPSASAATKCFQACKYNMHMHRRQIETKNVEVTWIFTQSIFMAVNTMLWSLSYQEVRRTNKREEVEADLLVALECIRVCSELWPGVGSAYELYQNLTGACMKIYDKDGDIPISANSPSDSASVTSSTIDGVNRSRTTSPATHSSASLATPPEHPATPFGYINPHHGLAENHPKYPFSPPTSSFNVVQTSPAVAPLPVSPEQYAPQPQVNGANGYNPNSQYNPLPATFDNLNSWNPNFSFGPEQDAFNMKNYPLESPVPVMHRDAQQYPFAQNNSLSYADYLYPPSWSLERSQLGLNQQQQLELMQSLESHGSNQIENMIQQSYALFNPQPR